MRILAPLALVALLSGPGLAQDAPPATPEVEDGLSLMQQGARLLFRGLMSEMEPALDEMGRALEALEPALREMEPALRKLIALMDDVTNFHAPEILPNGDIIIRRKTPQELAAPPAEIEL